MDALDLPHANVASTSDGGYFAFRSAATHPDRIDRIVEFGWPTGAPMSKVRFAMRLSGMPGVGRQMAKVPPTRSSVRMILRQIGVHRALESDHYTDEMFECFLSLRRDTDSLSNELRSSPRVITPILGLHRRMLLSPGLLARIAVPVQLLWGAEDPNGGEDIARPFAAQLPSAAVEMLPNAGHEPSIDAPEWAAERTRAVLDASGPPSVPGPGSAVPPGWFC